MQDNYTGRVEHLELLSGLKVRHRVFKDEHVFNFEYNGRDVKEVFTYKKAKVFAEGVGLGKQIREHC